MLKYAPDLLSLAGPVQLQPTAAAMAFGVQVRQTTWCFRRLREHSYPVVLSMDIKAQEERKRVRFEIGESELDRH